MSAVIIDLAEKRRDKRQKEFLSGEKQVTLSPEELKMLRTQLVLNMLPYTFELTTNYEQQELDL